VEGTVWGKTGRRQRSVSILLPLEERRRPFSEDLYVKISDWINLTIRDYTN
jgi:hypothetical protein